ncbi:Dienelactone hydrolase [Neofusicoccum parvum]|uniref:Putative dienelactone hydrolase protein n=1 Tax=Botryosphaeria parva (strain UCR-NP2) TaxID=1287680 RepID=R1EHG9_BOTPV|nr:putative dienelactone hydrolase protein [Neofusicoccum parvum UCRNP2]GME31767.1 Dienelactone hydrolase [Neofusicoccum parvum]
MATLKVHGGSALLNWRATTPRLYVTAESDDFDDFTLQAWREEGFEVQYLPFGDGGKQYVKQLHSLKEGLGVGGTYAIVAFGDAASVCLETFIRQDLKLSALVAYYPSSIPDPNTQYMPSLRVMVHLAGTQIGVNKQTEFLGLQGKRRTITKKITPGIGTGGMQSKLKYPCYTYQGVEPGFAEHDLEEYDKVADAVAWSRSLDTIRRGFSAELNIETMWEENEEYKFHAPDTPKILGTLTDLVKPHVIYTPTMTGAKGKEDLARFYNEYFLPSINPRADPPTQMKTRLLSRTIGVDRIVDELLVSFKHSQPMPWILPGIPPTGLPVEIVLISIVAIKGGKVYSEHVYWDQAAVLVQVGLLDIEDVPEKWRKKGVKELPVVGEESARKVVDEEREPWNELIPDW